ncbi:hypothetical protein H6F76_18335 [Leptolyngbya sp. FACHB-321]|nr:hypothetical protein [Leptolyngbya sp. FACHB-321]MBD2036969.1 hypothetical protein [Leptolyngbya sp. FACHB-321]
MSQQPCPLCSTLIAHQERYPRAVCQNCVGKACDEQGRQLNFVNLSMSGGYGAVVAETGADYPSHLCYINGVKCWADEARFGGIVIQVQDEA